MASIGRRFVLSLCAAVGVAATGTAAELDDALAQGGLVDPERCSAAPLPLSAFVLPNDPGLTARFFEIVTSERDLPTGVPAPAADVADARAFAVAYAACRNAGDMRRLYALYTVSGREASLAAYLPQYAPPTNPLDVLATTMLRALPNDDRTEAAAMLADDLAEPDPLVSGYATADVRDVRVLPDGRLGAVIVLDGRPSEFHVYERVDGALRLDERVRIAEVPDSSSD